MTRRWSSSDAPAVCLAAFFLFIVVGFAFWPVIRTDTDLWYHLAAGRFMAATGSLPANSGYLSFLGPARPFVDYYWLFQKTLYAAFGLGGYAGLVALRAALVAAIVAICALLSTGARRPTAWTTFLFAATVVSLLPRLESLRPHLFEYLFLGAFLAVLDLRPGWALALPFLAALWGNFHGISFPVLLWCCGCFVAERLLKRAPPAFDERAFGLAALSMAAVFLTPLGAELPGVPFGLTARAQHQIAELRPLSPLDLLSVGVTSGGLDPLASQHLLLLVGVLSLAGALSVRRFRAAHGLLLLGGAGLLACGQRFFAEFTLLALPFLRENPPFEAPKAVARPVAWVAGTALMAVAVLPFAVRLAHRPAYPFSRAQLPTGVAEFLKREGGGGRLLNHPDMGGYWEWELLPEYRILMDMQTPFMFSEDDLFLGVEAYRDAETLKYFVDAYRPEFLEVPAHLGGFRAVIAKFPDFEPVFADGESVLYASRLRKGDLVRRWRMPVDPFSFGTWENKAVKDPAGLDGCRPRFVVRMLSAAPSARAARVASSRSCTKNGRPDEGERDARDLIRDYPENGLGWWLLGEALEAKKDDAAALAAFRKSLGRGGDDKAVRLRLASIYDRQGDRERARRERLIAAPTAPNLAAPGSENPKLPES
ncbi:MAG: hypothetical protein HY925_04790 [Elusimicrobia bacterium]|nr:hypothetical protein [Elusimicrobiota bacterium]